MSTPAPKTTTQAPGDKGTSAKQNTNVGNGSRPNSACKYKTETSAPKSAQRLRG